MQAAVRGTQQGAAPPPPVEKPKYHRTRRSVVADADGTYRVDALARGLASRRRIGYSLPAIAPELWRTARELAAAAAAARGERPPEAVSARLFGDYLSAVLEGACRPRMSGYGDDRCLTRDPQVRTLLGSIEERDAPELDARGALVARGEARDGDWAKLLGCRARHARRAVRLADLLGLVRHERNRNPDLGPLAELPSAVTPTVKLLTWLDSAEPIECLFTDNLTDPQSPSPECNVGEGFTVSGEAGQSDMSAPDADAASDAPSPDEPPPPSASIPEADEIGGRDGRAVAAAGKVLPFATRPLTRPAEGVEAPPTTAAAPPPPGPPGPPEPYRAPDDAIARLADRIALLERGVPWSEIAHVLANDRADEERRRQAEAEDARMHAMSRACDTLGRLERERKHAAWCAIWAELGRAAAAAAREVP